MSASLVNWLRADAADAALAFRTNIVAHACCHIGLGLFFTLALLIEADWRTSFDTVIVLWTAGAVMVGLASPVMGYLGDRLGYRPMMILFFAGMGASLIGCGLARGPATLRAALVAVGTFGAIYHPVGLAWLTRDVDEARRGRLMGVVGFAGSAGVALAALLAGWLGGLLGWRGAFIACGAAILSAGIVLIAARPRGAPVAPPPRTNADRAFALADGRLLRIGLLLGLIMFGGSVFYSAFTAVLPKWMEVTAFAANPKGIAAIGSVVAVVYLIGGSAQIVTGWLADRVSLGLLYAISFVIKLPLVVAAALVTGIAAFPIAIGIALMLDTAAPIESLLIARYSGDALKGFIYGLRYTMDLIGSPAAVLLVGACFTGGVTGARLLFLILAAIVAAMALLSFCFAGIAPEHSPLPLRGRGRFAQRTG